MSNSATDTMDLFADWGTYRELMSDRNGFQRAFCSAVLREPGLKGRVLDVGCGGKFPAALAPLLGEISWIDGVDPSDAVQHHPNLRSRWQARMEDSPVPPGTYDLALAYNVAEHVEKPVAFLAKIAEVLKPGGVFWFLTPHANHPFCSLVRLLQFLGRRRQMRAARRGTAGQTIINDYPAYYRMNCRSDVDAATMNLGFLRPGCFYFPCMQWDQYFPAALRWLPHAYDYFLGTRFKACVLLFACRLEKVT